MLPVAGSLSVVLLLKVAVAGVRPEWLLIGVALVLSYLVFAGLAFAFALDDDDRLVARAFWSRISSVFPKMEMTSDAG
jgi:hypothetical protein